MLFAIFVPEVESAPTMVTAQVARNRDCLFKPDLYLAVIG